MSSDSDLDHKDKSNMFPSIWSELHQSPGSRDVLLRLSQFYKSFSQHSKCPDHKAFANHAFIHFRHDCSLKEVFLGTLVGTSCSIFYYALLKITFRARPMHTLYTHHHMQTYVT